MAISSWKSQLPRGRPFDQAPDDATHLRFELRDLPGYELRTEEPAVLGVLGRVELEWDEGLFPRLRLPPADVKNSGWRKAQFTSSYA